MNRKKNFNVSNNKRRSETPKRLPTSANPRSIGLVVSASVDDERIPEQYSAGFSPNNYQDEPTNSIAPHQQGNRARVITENEQGHRDTENSDSLLWSDHEDSENFENSIIEVSSNTCSDSEEIIDVGDSETQEDPGTTEKGTEEISQEITSKMSTLPKDLRKLLNDLLKKVPAPKDKKIVMSRTLDDGWVKTFDKYVLLIPNYIARHIVPDSKEEKLFHEYTLMCKADSNTETFLGSIQEETFEDYKCNISKYLMYLSSMGHDEVIIYGDLVVDFLKSQRIVKRPRIIVSGIKTMVNAVVFLRKLWANYRFRNLTDAMSRNELVDDHLKFPDQNKVEAFLKAANNTEALARKNDVYYDDDLMVNQEVYTDSELKDMMIRLYNSTSRNNERPFNSILEILFGECLLLEQMEKRALTFRDLSFQNANKEHPFILKFRLTHQETEGGRKLFRTVSCARHKDPQVCLVGAIAMNYWHRFDFRDGPLFGPLRPDFSKPDSYHFIKLQYSTYSNQTAMVSAKYQGELAEEALGLIGKSVKYKAHLICRNNARRADQKHMRGRQGEWPESSYGDQTLIRFLKAAAGFDVSTNETYFIARAHLIPPVTLQKKIFPWLEGVKESFNTHTSNLPEGARGDTFAPKFFELLEWFRVIILQDLVYTSKTSPRSMFATHEIVKDPEFLAFQSSLEAKDPSTLFLESHKTRKDVVDAIAPRILELNRNQLEANIRSHHATMACISQLGAQLESKVDTKTVQLESKMSALERRVSNQLKAQNDQFTRVAQSWSDRIEEEVSRRMEEVSRRMEGVSQMVYSNHFQPNVPPNAPPLLQPNVPPSFHPNVTPFFHPIVPPNAPPLFHPNGAQIQPPMVDFTPRNASVMDTIPVPSPPPPLPVPPPPPHASSSQESGNVNEVRPRAVARSRRRPPRLSPPSGHCKLNLYVNTIPTLVDEWFHSNTYRVSVADRDRMYGTSWRKHLGVRQTYFRRKKVIRFIEKFTSREGNTLSRNQVTNLLEYIRIELRITLSQMCDKCQEPQIATEVIELSEDPQRDTKLSRHWLNFDKYSHFESPDT